MKETRQTHKNWTAALVAAFTCAISLLAAPCLAQQVLRTGDGAVIAFQQMMEEIKGRNIVFVGEIHSNLRHHKSQLEMVKALKASKVPVAIGLEMFRASSQKELDEWITGTMSERMFAAVYNDNWGMPWPWYMNILKYARQTDIPLVGLNLPSAVTEKVSKSGMEALNAEEKKLLPPGVTFTVDNEYKEQMRSAYEAHSEKGQSLESFCLAQMVWDRTMAYHLVKFLEKNRGRTVVVMAGIEHAGKKGIPRQIQEQGNYTTVVILPEVEGRIGRNGQAAADADYILLDESKRP